MPSNDELDVVAEKLKEQVEARARWYMTPPKFDGGPFYRPQAHSWAEALERAATDLCKGWHWIVAEKISMSPENADFILQQYHGDLN